MIVHVGRIFDLIAKVKYVLQQSKITYEYTKYYITFMQKKLHQHWRTPPQESV